MMGAGPNPEPTIARNARMDPLRIFRRFFPAGSDNAYHVYGALVAQARRPYFYAGLDVADTLDGRFDMILLHAALVLHRLNAADGDKSLAQDLVDVMFADLDRSLREMGVGDLSVAKKIKPMAQAFSGRADAYGRALDAGSTDDLAAAIARNLFPLAGDISSSARGIANYALAARDALGAQQIGEIRAGQIAFPDPERASRGGEGAP